MSESPIKRASGQPPPAAHRAAGGRWLLPIVLAALLGGTVDRGSIVAETGPLTSQDSIRDQDIAFYESRVARDPQGALDRAMLGSLYLQRARETGRGDDLVRAEELARESFTMRTRNNAVALHVLASSLVGQHRYREALEAVTTLVADNPDEISYRALEGEIAMELGEYAMADSIFETLQSWRLKLSVAPRLARWEELKGNPERSLTILGRARETALAGVSLPREQKAWFHLRVGELHFQYGSRREAEKAWRAGLALSPNDHRLLAALGRLESRRGNWSKAITYGERATAQSLDPSTLGLLADAYAMKGDSLKSADYARTLELVVMHQPGAYHRAWSLFLLDHNRQVEKVLENVKNELKDRKDIYGYDLLAWALYKNGQPCEAREAMHQAMALGSRDPQLLTHQKAIERAPCRS